MAKKKFKTYTKSFDIVREAQTIVNSVARRRGLISPAPKQDKSLPIFVGLIFTAAILFVYAAVKAIS